LNVFSINVPPLRDRTEDIPILVWEFVKEYSNSMGKVIEKIPQRDMEALKKYPWPGNVRELRNVIEQSMIVTKSTTLRLQQPAKPEIYKYGDKKLEMVERNHIVNVLDRTGWQVRGKGGAAEILGLKESTLRAKMKKLGIHRPGSNSSQRPT